MKTRKTSEDAQYCAEEEVAPNSAESTFGYRLRSVNGTEAILIIHVCDPFLP